MFCKFCGGNLREVRSSFYCEEENLWFKIENNKIVSFKPKNKPPKKRGWWQPGTKAEQYEKIKQAFGEGYSTAKEIQEFLNIPKATISESIKKLVEEGYIYQTDRYVKGRGRKSYVYDLVAWRQEVVA